MFRRRAVRPVFDDRSRLAWVILIVCLTAQQLLYRIFGFNVEGAEPWRMIGFGVPLAILAVYLRGADFYKTATAIETVVLLKLIGLTCFLLQFPMLAVNTPLADAFLLRADSALGFDWTSFARPFSNWIWHMFLNAAYGSFRLQGVVVLIFLAVIGDLQRAWQLLTAVIISLLFVILLLPLLPAVGTFLGCGLRPAGVMVYDEACRHVAVIHGWKSGAFTTVTDQMYLGLASFPSFHVAGAVILVWGVWQAKILRWLWLAMNILLTIAAIVVGTHYFVDILGGIALAWATIALAKRIIR